MFEQPRLLAPRTPGSLGDVSNDDFREVINMPAAIRGILHEQVHALRGPYPAVPPAPPIDLAALTAGDADPLFVTLPVAQVGAVSQNGRRYDRAAVEAIVRAIQAGGVDGIKGHLRDDERGHRYDLPSLYWVGATLDEDGIAWAKAYIPPREADLREHVRLAKASNAPLGTSLYGTANLAPDGTVRDLRLESIDLAHPARVGVPEAVALPHITRETQANWKAPMLPETFYHDSENLNLQHLLGETDDLAGAVRDLISELDELRHEHAVLLDDAIDHAVAQQVRLPAYRPVIAEQVRAEAPATRHEVNRALRQVLQRPAIQTMLRDAAENAMGPPHTRPVSLPTDTAEDQRVIQLPAGW